MTCVRAQPNRFSDHPAAFCDASPATWTSCRTLSEVKPRQFDWGCSCMRDTALLSAFPCASQTSASSCIGLHVMVGGIVDCDTLRHGTRLPSWSRSPVICFCAECHGMRLDMSAQAEAQRMRQPWPILCSNIRLCKVNPQSSPGVSCVSSIADSQKSKWLPLTSLFTPVGIFARR